jgi:hypothetical protein
MPQPFIRSIDLSTRARPGALRCIAPIWVAALLIGGAMSAGGVAAPQWREAAAETQGVDPDVFVELLDDVRAKALPLHSLLVIRHGAVVLDASLYPYQPDSLHDVASVTKSVMSILVGIALDKGLLTSVDQSVVAALPKQAPARPDSRLAHVTLSELLTMRSGFACDAGAGEPVLSAMRQSPDWAAYALALPFAADPGKRFAYCSSNNHLLSLVLSARTGMSARAFAQQHLFEPTTASGCSPRSGGGSCRSLFGGAPEAEENLLTAARNARAAIAKNRERLEVPAVPALADKLAAHYRSAALGDITVRRTGSHTVFDFGEWRSSVASRRNDDGTVSFATIEPGISGMAFVVAGETLGLCDMQHEYVFTSD